MSGRRRHRGLRAFALALALAGVGAGACSNGQRKPDAPLLARIKLAHELVVRGDWGRAFVMLDELHRELPHDADILTLRGIVYRERGLYADAETDLRAALAATPDSAEAHAALGILYDVEINPDAEAQHRAAVRLSPENPTYLNNLGFSLFLHRQFKEAIAEYEKAARLAPLSRRVRTNLGFACAASGDWRRAAREFAMGGTEAEAKNNLGFAYERKGDLGNAYDLYLEALRLDPKIPKARSNLVHAAAVLGRPVPPEAEAAPPSPTPPDGPPAAAPTSDGGATPASPASAGAPSAELTAPSSALAPPSAAVAPATPKKEAKP